MAWTPDVVTVRCTAAAAIKLRCLPPVVTTVLHGLRVYADEDTTVRVVVHNSEIGIS